MEQAASDLEENLREQQELVRRIEALREEETLLRNILDLAGDSAALPEQARKESTPAPSGRGRQDTAARQRRDRKARKSAAAPRPLLRDLLLDLLRKHEEPCPAHRLREELLGAHPDRTPTPQVVRNTLEGLVAKGLVQRHKQDRSVLYTALD
ncbi:BlaI/MecI/CopY family transcriptional regulator [Streptomyces misionensis]